MLREIYCEEFYQKHIFFNPGLSVVLGTNAGDNSIGKSTFLLIVDYVLGGKTYATTSDIQNNVGTHDIFFSFEFDGEFFWFCRNSIQMHTVWKCNEFYEKAEEISIENYCAWLKDKYKMSLPNLSFRDAVGRYARVYGKNNCDEKHPLHYLATERAESACYALLKLFDAYTPLINMEAEAERSKADLDTYKKAQKSEFIANITKATYKQNQKNIEQVTTQINELESGLENGLHDADAVASEEAVDIKQLLSRARRAKSRVRSQWNRLDENGNYMFSSTQKSFDDLHNFFPNIEIAHLEEIESFHRTIASVFKAELREERAKLEKELKEYDSIIHEYEEQLKELVKNPNLSKVILKRHAELLREKDRMEKENGAYSKLQKLKQMQAENIERLNEVKHKQFTTVSYRLNKEMCRINNLIYEGSSNAPVLDFKDSGYIFFTPDDTGTGIAYKGLIVYDLAVLNLTKLPLLVHDSVVLKQISDEAIEKIVELYSNCGKQVIISLDKQDSYSEKTSTILGDAAVLSLAGNGHELFGRSWG